MTTATQPNPAPATVRVLLGERASKALLEAGECFAIVGRSSYPDQPGRMAVYLQAVPLATAAAACGVIAGTHTARRNKPSKPTSASQPIDWKSVP